MRRISSLLFSLAIVFSCVGFCVKAALFDVESDVLKPFYSLQTASARDLLNAYEKEIFDAIVDSPVGTDELAFETLSGESVSYAAFSSIDIDKLFFAVLKDCPQLFWIEGMSLSYDCLADNNSNGAFDEGDTVSVKLSLPRNTVYSSVSDIYSYIASLVCAQDFSSCNTRRELLLAVHDFVADSISPDAGAEGDECVSNEANDRAHNVAGALFDGVAACEGYAKAFKLFCDYLKIPCITVCDGEHMWNGVYMDDGNWYYVDVANDDVDDERTYAYFLVGSETPDGQNADRTFAETHASLSDSATPNVAFSEYACPAAEGDAGTAFSSTVNSAAVLPLRILKRSVYQKDEPVYYNGIAVSGALNSTGDKFSVKSGKSFSGEEWTLVLLGDINGDGVCDADDYALLKTRVLTGESGFVNGIFDIAGDMNCDGYLDVLDIMLLERCVSGANRNIEIS